MEGMGKQGGHGSRTPITYCVVPRELASKLHEPLRRHFSEDPGVEVVVERRDGERRAEAERRSREEKPPAEEERRRVRNVGGRRMGERRAATADAERPQLPRRARPYADRLRFVELARPTGEQAEDLDTARLVARIQGGDREAFATLYMRYFDRVYGYLRLVLSDTHLAEDATQEVFVRVMGSIDSYERRGRQPFRSWLFVVVRNYALSQLRKSQAVDFVDPFALERREELGSWDDPTPDALGWLNDQELLLFLERLPILQRQVVMLCTMLDLSTAEAAQVLGSTPTAVRALHSRALRALRARLTAIGRAPSHSRRAPIRRGIRQSAVLRGRRFALRS